MASSGREAAIARRRAQSRAGMGSQAAAAPVGSSSGARGPVSGTAATGRALARARRKSMSASGAAGIEQRDRRRGQALPEQHGHASHDASKGPCNCGCRGAEAKTADAAGEALGAGAPAESLSNLAPGVQRMAPGRREAMARRRAQSRTGRGTAGQAGQAAATTSAPQPQAPAASYEGTAHGEGAHASAGPSSIITGTVAGSGSHVTGAEPGRSGRVTGTEYLPRGRAEEEARRSSAGMKVGRSRTSRGGIVSGTPLGRSFLVTGNEPGSCKMVTGDQYVGGEQYTELCAKPAPSRRPAVSVASTSGNRTVTGSLPGRSSRVTGDEPGTCEAVTGTPYSGKDEIEAFCDENARAASAARARPMRATPGPDLTGQQPGLNGHLTGAERGACEAVTGTPYVGKDQYRGACGAEAPAGADNEAHNGSHAAPWTAFSVMSPAREARLRNESAGAGPRGQITGPFGMGHGKVTGTEAFRNGGTETSGAGNTAAHAPAAAPPVQRTQRITGEGIDAGLRITGDDWDRGDRVTGTEGSSSTVRNPTRRGGPMAAMGRARTGGYPEPAAPESRVTGGAGASSRGALVTVSGGARG